jgi:hypothetical protein
MLTLRTSFVPRLVCALAMLSAAHSASAAPVTLIGSFFSVSFDDQAVGGMGLPTLNGDTVFFTPTTSVASAPVAGSNSNHAAHRMSLTVTLAAGLQATSLYALSRGDYLLLGSDSSVSYAGRLALSAPGSPLSVLHGAMQLNAPMDQRDTDPTINWVADRTINLPGSGLGADSFDVAIEMDLDATVGSGDELGFVEQKFFAIQLATQAANQVPVTSSAALLGIGLAAVARTRRRATPATSANPPTSKAH